MEVTMTVNGEEVTREIEPALLLVHFLRDTLGLTGTHWGCDTSNCGACVVQMDGAPGQVVHGARGHGRGPRDPHDRVAGGRRRARPGPAGLPRGARPAVRLLHARDDHDRPGAARRRTPIPPRRRSGRRSRARSAAAPGTRTSSGRSAGRPSTRAPNRRGAENGHVRDRRDADRLRQHEAQGGRALHPRPGQVPRRHRPARDAARCRAAQPVRPRAHRLDRYLRRARPPQGAQGHHRQGPRDPGPGLDADDLLRLAGRARGRQGQLPGPGGRLRRRRGPLRGARRASADRRRVRAAARGRQRPQGAGPRRAADPRRQAGPDRQPRQSELGGRRQRRKQTGCSPRPTPSSRGT